MRYGLFLATALTVLSTTAARAEDWCGYDAKEKALIECGYSTVTQCENAMGKGGMCFMDPDYARNQSRVGPVLAAKFTGKITAPHG